MKRFDPAVTGLLDANAHPLRKEIDQLRELILGADGSIVEGVKWNAASFRISDWFATLNGPKQVKEPMVILHAGAKAKGIVLKDRITDPSGLIKWLGNDRGQIVFADDAAITANARAFQELIRQWIQLL
ncbi:MAG TPA: DUF1801 domain-containing protein [Flavobacteriales bacterium]